MTLTKEYMKLHVYEVSVAHRTGGWKGRLAALERAGSPFGIGNIDIIWNLVNMLWNESVHVINL